MKRKIHEAQVREKILKTSRKLLMEQGYGSTTIRQITRQCDVQIGTVYHFFKNKEDIFSSIAESLFDRIVQIGKEGVDEEDVCLAFAREIRLHLNIIFNDEKSRELYLAAYNSPIIAQRMFQKTKDRNKYLFARYNPDFTNQDYLVRASFINGSLQALAMQADVIPKSDQLPIIHKTIRLMLFGFNVPLPTIVQTIQRL